MKRDELENYLKKLLQPELFQDYCPNGLQVAGKEEINSIATGVSASLSTIKAAVVAGADALIVHHGMFWKGDPYPLTGTRGEKAKLLLDSGISLFAYHLPLDAHREVGNNWRAAEEMGWKNCKPFGEFGGSEIGVIGEIDSCDASQVRTSLESYYKHPAHYAPGGKNKVQKIALISGGAHKAIEEASRFGADAFITGSFDEPIWHLAEEEGVHFYAMGHAATERVGPRALGEKVAKELGIAHSFLEITNPF